MNIATEMCHTIEEAENYYEVVNFKRFVCEILDSNTVNDFTIVIGKKQQKYSF